MTDKPTYDELEQCVQELEKAVSNARHDLNAFQEKEEKFRAAFEGSHDAITLTTKEGTVLDCNHRALELFGLQSKNDFSDKRPADFSPPLQHNGRPSVEISRELINKVFREGKAYQFEWLHQRQKGEVFPAEIILTPVKIGNQEVLQAVIRDITERKWAEGALRESENRFQRMLSVIPDMISIHSPQMDILYSNWSGFASVPESKRILNTKCYRTYRDFDDVCPDCQAKFVLASREPFQEEIQLPDGTWVDLRVIPILSEDNNVEMFMEWVCDITKRKQAEEALKESEALLEATGRMARVGGWQLDAETMSVTWTKETYRIHEVPLDYKPPLDKAIEFFHPDDREALSQAIQRALDRGEPYDMELQFITAKGNKLWTRSICRPEVVDGKTVRLRGTFQDITERKRAQEELESHYALLRIAGRTAKFGGWSVDLGTNIATWSDEVAEIHEMPHGYSPEVSEAIQFYAPEWQDRITQVFRDCAEKGVPYDEEMEIITGTGKRIWVRTNGEAVPDLDGKIAKVQGAFQDITERIEKELEYEQILKTALDGFWLIDSDGRLLEVNDSAASQLGYTPEEMNHLTIQDIDANETPEETRQHMQLLKEEGSVMFETLHRRKDGRLIDVEVSASYTPIGGGRFVVFTREITARKRAEREDQLNKARLEIIHKIATMPEATEKDICDFVLESMIELTESAIGFLGFISEDEQIMQIHAWSSSAMTECAIHDKPIEFPIAKAGLWGEPVRNREPILVNDYSAPHPAKNGCPEGHVHISRFTAVPVFEGDRIVAVSAVGNRERPYSETDVRQLMLLMDSWWEQVRRKRVMREREVLQARLQQAQKMESIGTLAGGIAHDFNNILSIILGNTEMALHDLPEWSPAQESLKEAREASLRARDLVTQMLLFARQKEQAISNLRVEPIARESLKMLRASIPATIEIREDIQEGLPPVLADPSQIQQIIMNLCTNAAQVMEENGGRLDFRLDAVALKGALDTFTEPIPEGRYVRISVRDNGPGIAPEYVERIFDPFFTTKGVGEGTGLGLAVVHGIVQGRHGGITVESEPDKGTTFSVYLPASKDDGLIEETSKEEPELPKGTERILFVDDEPMIMKLGQRMLERQGYKVETRASGTVALECFRQDPNRFDLVVTDMTMPGLRGDNLAKELLKIRSDIPVILSTGFSKQISGEKAEELGIRAFVMKPLTAQELASTVRRVLDEK